MTQPAHSPIKAKSKNSVVILGSTGSIGVATLNVIDSNPQAFTVYALVAGYNHSLLFDQCQHYKPAFAYLSCPDAALHLKKNIDSAGLSVEVLVGEAELLSLLAHETIDTVVSAFAGAVGLKPTLAALDAGKRVLLANKESLVAAGELMISAARQGAAELLPIDTEHNAIFQCLPQSCQKASYAHGLRQTHGVRRLHLTASGGPFWRKSSEEIAKVTLKEALKHPVWSMGKMISINSASMMNKGLELIEACWLFSLSPSDIQVVIHPQGIVHSMVEYTDGSIIAQLSRPDQRIAIGYGLHWPERGENGSKALDIFDLNALSFHPADEHKFPCLRLAKAAITTGGTAPAILNAANEIAVQALLDNKILFKHIAPVVESTLEKIPSVALDSLDGVLSADQEARSQAAQLVSHYL